MALYTKQQLNQYYDKYQSIDVTFTKQVARAIGVRASDTFFRFLGYQLPCIIYSSSMVGAKILAGVNAELFKRLREANNLVSIRFSLDVSDKQDPVSFFVTARIAGYSPYDQKRADLNFIALTFTQRPSDDLIGVLGQLLDANINSKKRKEERIAIDDDSVRKLGLVSREAQIQIEDATRKCILRDLSFSGANALVSGNKERLMEKTAQLRIEFDEGRQTHLLEGKIVRVDEFQNQKDIVAAGIYFGDQVSMEYKMRLNEFLVSIRKPSA